MHSNAQTRRATSTKRLASLLRGNREGRAVGIYALCSANRYVLEAGMQQAKRDDSLLLIESTPNQVNQFGGYTGQKPADFANFVREVAAAIDFPFKRIVLGGDHLGPHVWRKESSKDAMEKALVLVRDYVLAGYTKIHLDTSMHCADDAGNRHRPLSDEIVSVRAAELCVAAESAHREFGGVAPAPLYVIGTEVPIPGGGVREARAPEVTRTQDLQNTLRISKRAFVLQGLESAWERVIAVVVQPGIEFGDASLFPYDRQKARALSKFVGKHWHGVYEAHSTDYQPAGALREMVKDHFAILKVGPWLTFAFREALFALAAVEEEWLARRSGVTLSHVRKTLDHAMVENPSFWKDYYHGEESALQVARKYSYSDRSRYYWPQPKVAAALDRLIANLTAYPPPDALLSQYLPRQSELIRERRLERVPGEMIRNKIREVLRVYAAACGSNAGEKTSC